MVAVDSFTHALRFILFRVVVMALVSDGYRPGDSRRAELRSKAKDKVDIDIPKSKSGKRVKIDRYYRAAEKVC